MCLTQLNCHSKSRLQLFVNPNILWEQIFPFSAKRMDNLRQLHSFILSFSLTHSLIHSLVVTTLPLLHPEKFGSMTFTILKPLIMVSTSVTYYNSPSPFSSHSSLVSLVLVWWVCQGLFPPDIQIHHQSSCGEDCLMGLASLSEKIK